MATVLITNRENLRHMKRSTKPDRLSQWFAVCRLNAGNRRNFLKWLRTLVNPVDTLAPVKVEQAFALYGPRARIAWCNFLSRRMVFVSL